MMKSCFKNIAKYLDIESPITIEIIIDLIRDIIVFVLLKFSLVGCNLKEVRKSTFIIENRDKKISTELQYDVIEDKNLENCLKIARSMYDSEMERTKNIYDKGKNLLAICSIVFSLFFIKTSINDFSSQALSYLFTITFLIASLFLLFYFFKVRPYNQISLDNDMLAMEEQCFKRQEIKDLIVCFNININRNNFFAEVYRSSLSFMFLAFLSILISSFLALYSVKKQPANEIYLKSQNEILTQIRATLKEGVDSLKNDCDSENLSCFQYFNKKTMNNHESDFNISQPVCKD